MDSARSSFGVESLGVRTPSYAVDGAPQLTLTDGEIMTLEAYGISVKRLIVKDKSTGIRADDADGFGRQIRSPLGLRNLGWIERIER